MTGLAQFPRTRLTQISFVQKFRFVHMRRQAIPVTEFPATGKNIFPYEHSGPVTAMYFHLRSVDKATIFANDVTLCVSLLVSSLEFHPSQSGWNFPYEQSTKFVRRDSPAVYRAHMKRPLYEKKALHFGHKLLIILHYSPIFKSTLVR